MFKLIITAGPDKGLAFSLDADQIVQLGRSQAATHRLTDPAVSRVHCEIEVIKGNRVLLTDLESRGTYVNGKRVEEALLKPGDVIRVGETELRFEE